eukprot:TRINITY_DN3000_c0_g4_i2.p1 TRINITY_DN3000_c0_g4~~TRINITY_DN3000_c0_g4_i2.p1  ORF type:complete len:431 (-),score=124.82 TRINITY_DN3000_c0_g4_i2:98-1390(-)
MLKHLRILPKKESSVSADKKKKKPRESEAKAPNNFSDQKDVSPFMKKINVKLRNENKRLKKCMLLEDKIEHGVSINEDQRAAYAKKPNIIKSIALLNEIKVALEQQEKEAEYEKKKQKSNWEAEKKRLVEEQRQIAREELRTLLNLFHVVNFFDESSDGQKAKEVLKKEAQMLNIDHDLDVLGSFKNLITGVRIGNPNVEDFDASIEASLDHIKNFIATQPKEAITGVSYKKVGEKVEEVIQNYQQGIQAQQDREIQQQKEKAQQEKEAEEALAKDEKEAEPEITDGDTAGKNLQPEETSEGVNETISRNTNENDKTHNKEEKIFEDKSGEKNSFSKNPRGSRGRGRRRGDPGVRGRRVRGKRLFRKTPTDHYDGEHKFRKQGSGDAEGGQKFKKPGRNGGQRRGKRNFQSNNSRGRPNAGRKTFKKVEH